MTNYSVKGGPAVPAKVVTSGSSRGGPAIPVYQILPGDGIQVQGGPGVPMRLITDPAYPRIGGPALPIQYVAPGINPQAQGGEAIPVYCLNYSYLASLMEDTPPYIAKCKGYNPIALWPLISNTNDYSGNGFNGAPTNISYQSGAGVDGRGCAYFNDNAWVDIYSAGLSAAFNGDEVCIGGWCRQTAAALIDADTHDFPVIYSVTAGTHLFMRSTSGDFKVERDAGGVHKAWTALAAGTFGGSWRHVMFRLSIIGDFISVYIDGVRKGPYPGSAAWGAGGFATNGALWGASSGDVKIHHWLGWMQYVGIYPLLSEAEIQDLAITPI